MRLEFGVVFSFRCSQGHLQALEDEGQGVHILNEYLGAVGGSVCVRRGCVRRGCVRRGCVVMIEGQGQGVHIHLGAVGGGGGQEDVFEWVC